MKLGSLLLKSRAILSPLESVSDVGFRSLCAELGAGLTWTEMIRAQALAKNNRSAMDLIDTHDPSSITPTGIQLLAKTPMDLRRALERIDDSIKNGICPHYNNAIAIDLNFGCPSPAILREGAGPALLKRRKRLSELFQILAEWRTSTNIPIGAIGCKIRLGLNQSEVDNKVYLDVLDLAVEGRLDYLTVHGRHAAQRSSIPASWPAIREIATKAKATGICIIGNGDIYSAQDSLRMMLETGCDGVMIARGAIKNPWVFADIKRAAEEINAHVSSVHSASDYPEIVTVSPSLCDVERAEASYMKMAEEYCTKSKYVDFHTSNFRRLKQMASGVSVDSIPFSVPRNQHIA